jgi:hypothetical protein
MRNPPARMSFFFFAVLLIIHAAFCGWGAGARRSTARDTVWVQEMQGEADDGEKRWMTAGEEDTAYSPVLQFRLGIGYGKRVGSSDIAYPSVLEGHNYDLSRGLHLDIGAGLIFMQYMGFGAEYRAWHSGEIATRMQWSADSFEISERAHVRYAGAGLTALFPLTGTMKIHVGAGAGRAFWNDIQQITSVVSVRNRRTLADSLTTDTLDLYGSAAAFTAGVSLDICPVAFFSIFVGLDLFFAGLDEMDMNGETVDFVNRENLHRFETVAGVRFNIARDIFGKQEFGR